MKRYQFSCLLSLVLLMSFLLTGCAGGAGMASSWPGLLVDTPSGVAFLARNNFVFGINLSNGTEKWRFPLKADAKALFFSQPRLTDDGQLVAGSYNNVLYSINPQTGQQNWTFADAKDKYIGAALTTVDGIFAPNADYNLYALNNTGSQRWFLKTDHSIWTSPLTDGERIFIASMDHYVYAIDPNTGIQVWKSVDLGGAIVHSFVIDPKGVLYVGTIGDDLLALSAETGDILWKTPLQSWIWSKTVISDSTLFIADQEGFVYALDAKTGAIIWQIQPDTTEKRAIISTPLLVEKTLYVANQAGNLFAVDVTNGSVLWNKTIGGNISTDLEISGDTILIAPLNFDSALVAIDLQGNNRWSYEPAK